MLPLQYATRGGSARSQDITGSATAAGPIHLATTYVEGLCIDGGSGVSRTLVTVQQCAPTAATAQDFLAPSDHGALGSFQIQHEASGLCLSGEHSATAKGTPIDLYGCKATGNMLWILDR